MSFKIFSFIDKIGDIFPIGGGAAGAASQANQVIYSPTWGPIITTLLITVVGAALGYLVKLGFDYIFRKFKKKHNI